MYGPLAARRLKVAGVLFKDIDCDVSLALEIICPIAVFWLLFLAVSFAWAARFAFAKCHSPNAFLCRWEGAYVWEWRGKAIAPRSMAIFRWANCIWLTLLTLVTLVWRIWDLGLAKGFALQFTYLTQWGIMLNNAFFLVLCVSASPRPAARGVHKADGAGGLGSDVAANLGEARWQTVLVPLHALALCTEVTVFFMWLAVAFDASLHLHVLAPCAIVIEFALNRLPIRLRDLPLLFFVGASFLACNFAATRCWFIVYPGVMTYKSGSFTWVYTIMAGVICTTTFIISAVLRRCQLVAKVTNVTEVTQATEVTEATVVC